MRDECNWSSTFGCWYITFIMSLQSFFQIFRTTSVRFSISTFQNVDVIHNLANPAFAKFGASSGLRPPKPDEALLRRAKAGYSGSVLGR
jgi:hypothetical protein